MARNKDILKEFWVFIQELSLTIKYGIYFLLALVFLVILIYATVKGLINS